MCSSDLVPASFLLWPNRGGAPVIVAGDWRLLAGSGGQGWIHGSRAVLLVVEGAVGVKGVAGGELRGGGGFGHDWGFGLWWLSIEAKRMGDSVRSRGVEWWC